MNITSADRLLQPHVQIPNLRGLLLIFLGCVQHKMLGTPLRHKDEETGCSSIHSMHASTLNACPHRGLARCLEPFWFLVCSLKRSVHRFITKTRGGNVHISTTCTSNSYPWTDFEHPDCVCTASREKTKQKQNIHNNKTKHPKQSCSKFGGSECIRIWVESLAFLVVCMRIQYTKCSTACHVQLSVLSRL